MPNSLLNSIEHSRLVDNTIRTQVEMSFATGVDYVQLMYNVTPSDNATEIFDSLMDIPNSHWRTFAQSGFIPKAGFEQGWEKTFTHEEFVRDLPIRQTLIEDARMNIITSAATRFGNSAFKFRQSEAVKIFNNGTSLTGIDGVALFSASHPYSPSNASVQSNLLSSNPLSYDNLNTAIQAMMNLKDSVEEPSSVEPDLLLVPVALMQTAYQLVSNPMQPNTANNNINANLMATGGGLRVVVWNRLSSSTTWYLISSSMMKENLRWFERVPFTLEETMTEQQGIWRNYRGRMRFSYGALDWRWVVANTA